MIRATILPPDGAEFDNSNGRVPALSPDVYYIETRKAAEAVGLQEWFGATFRFHSKFAHPTAGLGLNRRSYRTPRMVGRFRIRQSIMVLQTRWY